MPPKSTRHTVVGCDGNEHPIAVLSPVISLAGKQPWLTEHVKKKLKEMVYYNTKWKTKEC